MRMSASSLVLTLCANAAYTGQSTGRVLNVYTLEKKHTLKNKHLHKDLSLNDPCLLIHTYRYTHRWRDKEENETSPCDCDAYKINTDESRKTMLTHCVSFK